MALFVPLDVDYDSDDKIIEAGPLAELLFVRSLAFCKRKLNDGKITTGQLSVIGRGIPSCQKHAKRLVEVGLWTKKDWGWEVTAWKRRNKTAKEVEDVRQARKEASVLGNHERWHVGPQGKPSPTCPHCNSQIGSQMGSGVGSLTESQTESTEPEPEPEPEPKTEDLYSSYQGHQGAVDKSGIDKTISDLSERFRA